MEEKGNGIELNISVQNRKGIESNGSDKDLRRSI